MLTTWGIVLVAASVSALVIVLTGVEYNSVVILENMRRMPESTHESVVFVSL
jgi:hypothetical protein